jgi:hypothetical protein
MTTNDPSLKRTPPGTAAHMKRISALGTAARWDKAPPPYSGSFLYFLDAVDKAGPSRAAWSVFWKAVDAIPLDRTELATFQRHSGRTAPPATRPREVWCIAGRRSGKSEQMGSRYPARRSSTTTVGR